MNKFVRVAIPIRKRNLFDYRCQSAADAPVGSRVLVPFGRRKVLGMVVGHASKTNMPPDKIRNIDSVLEQQPAITADLMRSLLWAADYYHQPLGEVLWSALPLAVRHGRPLEPGFERGYKLTRSGIAADPAVLSRARVQKSVLEILQQSNRTVRANELMTAGSSWRNATRKLEDRGWVETEPLHDSFDDGPVQLIESLTRDQKEAHSRILSKLDVYQSFLIHGVTGSGKTEVYLHAICGVLESGGQALMLVPEIGLTPQLEDRVRKALGVSVSSYHSGLSPTQKHKTWWLARTGNAKVVIGTRSAVFLPFKNLRMIVVDEEHDTSFKQQDRVRYHARSVSIHRAASGGFPVVFGSATPSLETVHAAHNGRLETLNLPERATHVAMPAVHLIDLSRSITSAGVALPMLNTIGDRFDRKEQSLVFINRRGYAPVTICLDCKWVAKCEFCDANLIFHTIDNKLHCHHCFNKTEVNQTCPTCESKRVQQLGEGTQRVEQTLRQTFHGARVIRIDRDTTRSYAEFEAKLSRIHRGEADILVGTQMLSKGHHFPNVTLVCILNVDQGFYSNDFRAMEHMFQQVLQVAGRAGRVEKPGEVLIQTMHPDSEYFARISRHDYIGFAEMELQNRTEARQPPYTHYALLRADSLRQGNELEFLQNARGVALELLKQPAYRDVKVLDIVQSPIKRISNWHRAQLLTMSEDPGSMRQFLGQWVLRLDRMRLKSKLRWNLDVDPVDFV